jgi:murein DD-endopeptidase MepM/ murein hydrolase activator NlpD
MNRLFLFIVILFSISSCRTSGPGIFGKSTPHDQYAKKLSDAGLKETTLGNLWFEAAGRALNAPQSVNLPYRQTGYFAAEKPRAIGLQFTARRGEKLHIRIERQPAKEFNLYADLWKKEKDREPSLVESLDTSLSELSYEADENTTLILRLQPELLRSGEYTLSVSVGPSLAFPVAGKAARVGSVWGDSRDAGARRHEGIDVFAPKRTPVVASAEGTVNRVEETAIGGKVVWLKPKGRSLNLYYAHLDEQLVQPGQDVSLGDTIGLVGNTGNARTTPAHLHFGIYTSVGPVDPLPFVNRDVREAQKIIVPVSRLNKLYRTDADVRLADGTVPKNTIVLVTDADGQFYMTELPDGRSVKVPVSSVQTVDNQITALKIKASLPLLDRPYGAGARKKILTSGTAVRVLGYFNQYAFVESGDGERGWLARAQL